jgi:alpha-galactosidase
MNQSGLTRRHAEVVAGPGHFNDPDMLLTSTAGATRKLSPLESRAQFSLWAVLAAPLLIGGPVSALSSWDLETYTNKAVIAVNQDSLGRQGRCSTNFFF